MEEFFEQSKMTRPGGRGALRVQLPICERGVGCEVTDDVSLPDYQPAIKRLLRVSATVQPPAHYVGGGVAELSGTVDYCILYAGEDGQMYCFATSGDYAFRLPLEMGAEFDLNEGVVCMADCRVEQVVGRVSGPRRMNIKCRLKAEVRMLGMSILEEKTRGTLPEDCGEERLLQECESTVCGVGMSDPLLLSEDIWPEGEGASGREWRIISGDAGVMVSEVTCHNGRVSAKGEAVVKLLLGSEEEGGLPVTVYRKLPFEGQIPVDGAAIGGDAVVSGSCTELNLSMEEGRVCCEAEIVLQARSARRVPLSYTADWYATGCESSCTTQELFLSCPPKSIHANFTQSEQRTPEELGWAVDGTARVLDAAGVAEVESVSCERGRCVIGGKCRYSLILGMPDGEMTTKEVELPFRYSVDGVEITGPVHYEGRVTPMSIRARLDAQRLAIEAELGVGMRLWGEERIHPVRSMTVGERTVRPAGQTVLCYPARTDTLWSVGKRYHVPMDFLVESNGLQDGKRADAPTSLENTHVLLV